MIYFIHKLSSTELPLVYNNNKLISSFNDIDIQNNPYLESILVKENDKYYYPIDIEINNYSSVPNQVFEDAITNYNENNLYIMGIDIFETFDTIADIQYKNFSISSFNFLTMLNISYYNLHNEFPKLNYIAYDIINLSTQPTETDIYDYTSILCNFKFSNIIYDSIKLDSFTYNYIRLASIKNSDVENIIYKDNVIFEIYDVNFSDPEKIYTCYICEFTNLKKITLYKNSARIAFCPLLEYVIYNDIEYDLKEDIFLNLYNNITSTIVKPVIFCNDSPYNYTDNISIAKYSYPQNIENCFTDDKLTSFPVTNDIQEFAKMTTVYGIDRKQLNIQNDVNVNNQILTFTDLTVPDNYQVFGTGMVLLSYFGTIQSLAEKNIIYDLNNSLDYPDDTFIKEINNGSNIDYNGIFFYGAGGSGKIPCVLFLKNCYNYFSTANSTGLYFLKGIDSVFPLVHKFKLCVDTEESKNLLNSQGYKNIETVFSTDPNLNPYKPVKNIEKNIFYINMLLEKF